MPESIRRRQPAILAALIFSSATTVLLFVVRAFYSRSLTHGDMIWNLFLAWLPLLAAFAAYNLTGRQTRSSTVLLGVCAVLWLLFFPNAPYIVTDFSNLRPRGVPYWYDVLMYVSFAWNGMFLGLVSLYLMQSMVLRRWGAAASWIFAAAAVALSGFGVYLGRFPRFNSWDVITSPGDLLGHIWGLVSNPASNTQMVAFTAVFSLFLLSMYLIFVAMVQFPREAVS